MVDEKQPSYVDHLGSDGRRIYKREFVDGVVADIKSNKTTINEVSEKFGLDKSSIRRWVNPELRKTHNSTHRTKTTKKASPKSAGKSFRDLMDMVKDYEGPESPNEERWDFGPDHVRVALAYCRGEVSQESVNKALKKLRGTSQSKIVTTAWLGGVFKWAIRNGYDLTKKR